jgi:hypothetical protein
LDEDEYIGGSKVFGKRNVHYVKDREAKAIAKFGL